MTLNVSPDVWQELKQLANDAIEQAIAAHIVANNANTPFYVDMTTDTVTVTFKTDLIHALSPLGNELSNAVMHTRQVAILAFTLLAYGMDIDVLIQRITAEQ